MSTNSGKNAKNKPSLLQRIFNYFKTSTPKAKEAYKKAAESKSYEDIAALLLSFAGAAVTYWMITTVGVIILYILDTNVFSSSFMLKLYVNLSLTIPFGVLLGVSVKVAGQKKDRFTGLLGSLATLSCFGIISFNIWNGFDWGTPAWQRTLMIAGSSAFLFSVANGFMLAKYWNKYERFGKIALKSMAFLSVGFATTIIILADIDNLDKGGLIQDLARYLGVFVSLLLCSGFLGITSLLIRKEENLEVPWRKNTAIALGLILISATTMCVLTLTLEWYDWMRYIFTEKILGTTMVVVVAGIGIGVAVPSAREKNWRARITGVVAIATAALCAISILEEIYDWGISFNSYGDLMFHSWLFAYHAIYLCTVALIPKVNNDRQNGKLNLCWYSAIASIVLWESIVELRILDESALTIGLMGIAIALMVYGAIKAFLIYREEVLKKQKKSKKSS